MNSHSRISAVSTAARAPELIAAVKPQETAPPRTSGVKAILTADAHVVPEVLQQSGFVFTHPTVEDAVAAAVPAAS